MIIHRKISVLLLAATIFSAALLGSVIAQKSGDTTINPIFQEVTIDAQDTSRQFNVKLSNNTNTARTYRLKIADFGSLNETGGVAFIGVNKPGDENYRYGLSAWLKLEKETVTIGPGGTEQVNITLVNDSLLAPGGHYGAVLVSEERGPSDADSSKVELSQVISSLILAKKIGGEIYNLQLKSVGGAESAASLPSTVSIRFYNGGNVHLVPRGTVTVTDEEQGGKIIKEGLINSGSGFILPDTYRQYITTLQDRATAWWPGNYYQHVSFRYDGNDKLVTQTHKVFYIGQAAKLTALGLVTLAVLGLLRKRLKIDRFLKKSKKSEKSHT